MFPHCKPEDMGFFASEDAEQELIDILGKYFKQFVAPEDATDPKCICGRSLKVFYESTSRYEGKCAACGHPARGYHRVLDNEGLEIFNFDDPLPYHPTVVRANNARNAIKRHD